MRHRLDLKRLISGLLVLLVLLSGIVFYIYRNNKRLELRVKGYENNIKENRKEIKELEIVRDNLIYDLKKLEDSEDFKLDDDYLDLNTIFIEDIDGRYI